MTSLYKLKGNGKGEVDPNGVAAGTPGAKLDAGKLPIMRGGIQYFPRALRAIAALSGKGAAKYSWNGWESVPDGQVRYSDAMGRHILDEAIDGPWDDKEGGSGELHATAIAWNAMARLELLIREMENEDNGDERPQG
jgi:hypothetical protein